MTVKELIAILVQHDPDAIIKSLNYRGEPVEDIAAILMPHGDGFIIVIRGKNDGK